MYCKYCKRECNSSMCTILTTGSKILILLLNRDKNINIDVKINFYEFLNLNNYIQYNNIGANYRLIGVISLIQENMKEYYIAYCRDPISGLWHKYNDEYILQVNNFQEIIDDGIPNLLFYQKI